MDFRDFEDKVSCPITVLQNVTFHRTLLDRFLVAFQEQVATNAVYVTTEVSFKYNCKIIIYFIKCCVEYDVFIIICLKKIVFSYFLIAVKSWDFHVTWAHYPSASWTPNNADIRTRAVGFCSVRLWYMIGEPYRM
jgi:hypothetical protein